MSSGSIMIDIISKNAREAYCAAARLRAMGYEPWGMDEDDLYHYATVEGKSVDILEVLYDLYRVAKCAWCVKFVVWLGRDEYIYVAQKDLDKYFGFRYFGFIDCEKMFSDLSDYRYCVYIEEVGDYLDFGDYEELNDTKPGEDEDCEIGSYSIGDVDEEGKGYE